jgi:predicted RNA-binding Zn-ribbon protein involved in translation (DUF1610 family)
MPHITREEIMPLLGLLKQLMEEKGEVDINPEKVEALYESFSGIGSMMNDNSVLALTETDESILIRKPPWRCPQCGRKSIVNLRYSPLHEHFDVICPECGERFST